MKKLAFLFLGLLCTTFLVAQDELALTHQTITAKAHEMKVFDPVFLDLEDEQQVMVDAIVQMIMDGDESHLIAQKLEKVAKATEQDNMDIIRWAIREASIITLGLKDEPAARTWTFASLLETESAAKTENANAVKGYFEAGKSVLSSVE